MVEQLHLRARYERGPSLARGQLARQRMRAAGAPGDGERLGLPGVER